MKRYKVTYKVKVPTSGAGEISEYRLVTGKRVVRAHSFKEARDKVRNKRKYEIVDIRVEEAKKSWIRNLLKF